MGLTIAPKSEPAAQAADEAPQFQKVTWYKDPGLRKLYFYCLVLCIASATTGYDGSFFNAVQVSEQWKAYFGSPDGSPLGLLGSLYQIGSVVSIPIAPILCDNLGRKVPIIIGCVIMIAGAILQAAAHNIGAFMGGRALLGFGNSLAQIASPMLLTEIAHPQHRGRLTATYNCLFNAGAIVVSALSLGTNYIPSNWAWRIPAMVQGVPSVLQIIFIWWVPESPRYLMANDEHEKALNILARYHANGNVNDPTVQFEYLEISQTLKIEKEAKAKSSYLDFFRTKGNRYRLIVLISLGIFSQWSGNAIISNYSNDLYDQVGVTGATQKFGLQTGSTGMSLIVSVTMATLIDKFGRRPLFLTSTCGMFFVLILWTLTSGLYGEHRLPGSDKAMIFFIWVFSIFYAIAWSGLLVGYAIEILPYMLRAKGLMILNISIQIALLLNNYANPVAFKFFEQDHAWKLYIIYTFWVGLELIFVYFLYIETKGPTLEELAKIIDGENAPVAHLNLEKVEEHARLENAEADEKA
ncbi:general substrate transporter [Xylaria nigripes]|nr:general substrate transporter [Xylaria nigripes]